MTVYDHQFNTNEWFILSALLVGLLFTIVLPRRFSHQDAVIYFMSGVFSGFFFDHVLSAQPISFYIVNDTSKFQTMDFVSYWMYGPIGYMFFYFMDHFKIKKSIAPLYILIWSFIAVAFEGLAVLAGVFHYIHGYKIYFSFGIYLLVMSVWSGVFYRFQTVKVVSDSAKA